jgi:hypothetical protein
MDASSFSFTADDLYLGTPGHYEKVDAKLSVQGGNSMYYTMACGGKIELPYGYGGPNGETPTYDGQNLKYLDVESGEDPATFGPDLSSDLKVREPFPPAPPKPRR